MPLVATAAAAGQAAIPPSLQELVRDMEASDNQNVSTDLARKAKDLIADAIGGSMCEKKLGRRIPLAEALQHSRVELIAAVNEYSRVVSGSSIVMNMMFREAFNPVKSKKVISRELVKVSHFLHIIYISTNNVITTYHPKCYLLSDSSIPPAPCTRNSLL